MSARICKQPDNITPLLAAFPLSFTAGLLTFSHGTSAYLEYYRYGALSFEFVTHLGSSPTLLAVGVLPFLCLNSFVFVMISVFGQRVTAFWIYALSGMLGTFCLIACLCSTARPLPDLMMRFQQLESDVNRPMISRSEVPLVIIAWCSGCVMVEMVLATTRLFGAWQTQKEREIPMLSKDVEQS